MFPRAANLKHNSKKPSHSSNLQYIDRKCSHSAEQCKTRTVSIVLVLHIISKLLNWGNVSAVNLLLYTKLIRKAGAIKIAPALPVQPSLNTFCCTAKTLLGAKTPLGSARHSRMEKVFSRRGDRKI